MTEKEQAKEQIQCGKWCWQCSKEGHIAAECLERRRAAKSLWRVKNEEAISARTLPSQATDIAGCVQDSSPAG